MSTENKQTPVKKNELIERITAQVQELQETGGILLPSNYSVQNALKSAWLILQDKKDKSGKSVVEVCTPASIANALLRMVTQGLNPLKDQCYFNAYGDQLTYQRSYQGAVALAKRVANVKDVNARVIYKGDEYVTETDKRGVMNLVKHNSQFKDRDDNNIIGAYAVIEFNDGSTKLEDMPLAEIKRAWAMGFGGGNTKAHQNFTGEMCKKTVKARICKSEINSSSDSNLYDEDESVLEQKPSIPQTSNKESLSFDDHEEVKDEPKAIENNAPEPIKVNEAEKVKSTKAEKESKELFDQDAGF